MAWVRIHDGAMGNLKILRLSNSAFRLWVQGLCYCQTHLTDGLIPREALRQIGAKRVDVDMLSSALVDGKAPLWEKVEGFGFKVHDYLLWNDCREKVVERQDEARRRKAEYDARRKAERESRRAADVDAHAAAERITNAARNALPDALVTAPLTKPNQSTREEEDPAPSSARGRRPIFTGQRFVVFEWQLDNLMRMLGAHANDFDLHEWFFTLDARVLKSGELVPQRDSGAWLQQRTLEEAQRRGLPVAGKTPTKRPDIPSDRGCQHSPRCASTSACIARTLEEGRAERAQVAS